MPDLRGGVEGGRGACGRDRNEKRRAPSGTRRRIAAFYSTLKYTAGSLSRPASTARWSASLMALADVSWVMKTRGTPWPSSAFWIIWATLMPSAAMQPEMSRSTPGASWTMTRT